MKVQLRPTPSCLNKPEGSFLFIFMFLITVLLKLEVTASERLTNAEWWWEEIEKDSLASVLRCIKLLSLLVRMLFMRYGWKVIINHSCHCQKHFTNSLSTLRRTLASFFFRLNSHLWENAFIVMFTTAGLSKWQLILALKIIFTFLKCIYALPDILLWDVAASIRHRRVVWEHKLQRFPEQVFSPDTKSQTSLTWRFSRSATNQSLKAECTSVDLIKKKYWTIWS